jgi:hypothetical protein
MGWKERRQAKKKSRKGTLYSDVDFSGSPSVAPPDIFGRTGKNKLTGGVSQSSVTKKLTGVASPHNVMGRLSQRRTDNLYGPGKN